MATTAKKIVLVTGNRGLGLATAKAIASSSPSYHVIRGIRAANSDETSQSNISTVELDVTKPDSINAAVKNIEEKFGQLDVLINNAGVSSKLPSLVDNLTECISVNLLGSTRVTEAFMPLLETSPTPILLFISTVLGSITARSDPTHPFTQIQATGYRTSKAALNMLMACYTQDPARNHLKVFSICPGFLATGLNGPPDIMRKMGAAEPETGASLILSVVNGERDADKGKVVCSDGVRAW
ncbi:hypothetical protein EAF04_001665 [Stromatinia cepivora]|nr:hypothetical protein EAF04_001665 [Stromatinia cepivora]